MRRDMISCVVLGAALALTADIRASEPPDAPCDACTAFDWTKVPPLRPLPRLGMFVLYPPDAGYYSLLDQVRGDYQEKAPNLPWGTFAFTPGSAFDLDFRY